MGVGLRWTAVVVLSSGALLGDPASAAAPVPWCGSAASAGADLLPDAVSAFAWHVVYAVPVDGADRFGAWAPRIAGDAAELDAWWRAQDPARRPRFDLHSFPGCASEFGRLDISVARLPRPSAFYSDRAFAFPRVIGDLTATFRTFASADKAYLVYLDGVAVAGSCGQGGVGPEEHGPLGYAIVFLDACGLSGNDQLRPLVAVHEMVHAMGAVPPAAGGVAPPHACASDAAHVCDSTNDLMAGTGVRTSLWSVALDVGRDDYYGHDGPWWDIRDDSFLLHRLDSPDQAPPTVPRSPTATSFGSQVMFSWGDSADAVGPVWYRVYAADGGFREAVERPDFNLTAPEGETLVYHVRAYDAAGFLSDAVTIRFRVGYGLVDESGRLIQDTVRPSAVSGLTVRVERGRAVLRWNPAEDHGGLRGYRVSPVGLRSTMVRATSVSFPLRRVRGRLVRVEAIDLAGNIGVAATARVPQR